MLRFTSSVDGPRLAALGTSCPDHFLRTKIKPLFAAWDPETGDIEALKSSLAEGLVQYRQDYGVTTTAASVPTRRRCATRTRWSC